MLLNKIILEEMMNMNKNKKEIIIYTLCILIITNILWFLGYSLRNINEKSILAVLILALACFMPLIIALIMCKITKTKFRTLKIEPNIKKIMENLFVSNFFRCVYCLFN